MLIEALGAASFVNGMLRIQTFHQSPKGEMVPGEVLLIPRNRIGPVVGGLGAMVKNLSEQIATARKAEAAEEETADAE